MTEAPRSAADSGPGSRADGVLRRLAQVEPHEVAALWWSCAFFFCVLTGYSIVKPVRDTWGIAQGEYYRWLWTGTAVGTLLVTPVFGYLVSRFRRRTFVPLIYAIAIVCLLGFYIAHSRSTGVVQAGIGYGFYIWLSVFNLFATAVFWGFMVDLWRESQSKRLFGLIAAAGTVGALLGPLHVVLLQNSLTKVDLLLVSIVYFLAAIVCAVRLGSLFGPEPGTAGADWVPRVGLRHALEGVALFFRSRYLLLIGVYLAAQTMVAAVVYIEKGALVDAVFPTHGVSAQTRAANSSSQTSYFAWIEITVNVFALSVQLFLTGRLVRWLGIGTMLAILPLVNFAGFAMLAIGPTLVAYFVFDVAQRSTRFAVMKPAREVLFTVLSRDEKYKAKQFLDTAIYRSTDAIWAWLEAAMRAMLGTLWLQFVLLLPACLGWMVVGRRLGKREQELSSRAP